MYTITHYIVALSKLVTVKHCLNLLVWVDKVWLNLVKIIVDGFAVLLSMKICSILIHHQHYLSYHK